MNDAVSPLFGKLSWAAIPWEVALIRYSIIGMAALAAGLLGLMTWRRWWGVLWRDWLTATDHKRIGVMYIIFAMVMLLRGFIDALMMRTQQALAVGGSAGYLAPEHYQQIFSAHGTIMILFVAMPFIFGLMNIVTPLQIGARDVAFPFLNSLSLWLSVFAGALVMVSLAVGDFSGAGWSSYPPLSGAFYSPTVGVDYWTWAIQISGLGSLLTALNFTTTILRMRAPGMTLMKMPVFVWAILCTSILIILAFPPLTAALGMLSLDRYLGAHFFTNSLGGNPMLYTNLFWLWGHPEVYIVILPAFGVYSEITSTLCGKQLFGYKTMVGATAVITVLSFSVWLHHFFTMGVSPLLNTVFSIATMAIAIPTGVKIFNWLFTLYGGRVRLETPMLWVLAFLLTFVTGGMSGVMLALPGADYVLHNSEFLIAHFHTMLISGTLFALFAGYSFWFPKVFGFGLNERWGKRAFWCWVIGFYVAFMPLYVLGFMGMPRRENIIIDPAWQPWLIAAWVGTVIILCGGACHLVQLLVSIRQRQTRRDGTGDYWRNGRTLEWSIPSPPPPWNFAALPQVDDLDAWMKAKEQAAAGSGLAPPVYTDIHLPHNTACGFYLGCLAFVLGFGLVWRIGWLALVALSGIFVVLLARSMAQDVEEHIPATQLQRADQQFEMQRQAALAAMPPPPYPLAHEAALTQAQSAK